MSTPRLLLRGGTLVDPAAGTTRRADMLVVDGRIARVGEALGDEDARVIDAAGCFVSSGWTDLYARLGEPGLEHRETVRTGLRAAAAGGFTTVAAAPETEPPLDTHDAVAFVRAQGAGEAADVYVVGCLTKGRAGLELAEMGSLADAGAVAFSDGRFLPDAGLMRRALEYAGMLGRPVLAFPHDAALGGRGLMHEGAAGTRAGVLGLPAVAEETAIARDVLLAEYTGAHVHLLHATTARSIDLVREAKARGVRVTASVSATHLALTDEAVEARAYSPATKLLPPLRPADDVAAIRSALADGTLDAVFSDHAPHALFETDVEFAAAPFGISALETVWALVVRELVAPGVLTVAGAVRLLTAGPRRALGLPAPRLAEGEPASLTVFDASEPWTLDARRLRSKSRHTPFDGHLFNGRVVGVYNRGRWTGADV